MVDVDVVKERLVRGAYVGAGSFLSTFTANFIENKAGLGDLGNAVGQVGTGLAISVGVDEVLDPQSMQAEAGEYIGYGIQGSGFSSLADEIQTSQQTGRVVTVSSNTRQQREEAEEKTAQAPEYSLDTA